MSGTPTGSWNVFCSLKKDERKKQMVEPSSTCAVYFLLPDQHPAGEGVRARAEAQRGHSIPAGPPPCTWHPDSALVWQLPPLTQHGGAKLGAASIASLCCSWACAVWLQQLCCQL